MLPNLLFCSFLTHPLSSFSPPHVPFRCKCQFTNRTLVFHYQICLIPVSVTFFSLSVGLNCLHIIFPFCFLSPLDNTLQDWKTLALCPEASNYTAILTLDPTSSKKGYCLMNHVKNCSGIQQIAVMEMKDVSVNWWLICLTICLGCFPCSPLTIHLCRICDLQVWDNVERQN